MVSPRIFRSRFVPLSLVVLFLCTSAAAAFGDSGTFDLDGPKLEVMVTRAGRTLPITEVPNLAVGDRLWIHPDFPPDQAAHYILVAAFLRGATNIPPQNWFYKADTWDKKFSKKGLTITVPKGAQQVLLFLAPETNGDFKTLMGAVRGRPGAFVRASQDLNQAMLDRTRLDKYLSSVRKVNATTPENLKAISPLLARSLDVKVDPECLSKDVDEIAPCLTERADTMVLNDGHSRSIVEALTSGATSDLAMQASYTPQANFGYYSPYISSAMDIARIFNSFRTAEYQYIPALAEQSGGDALSLKLNTPPSFHNPKSVLVIALPAVEAAQPPPLHPVDENKVYCAQNTTLALPVDGAPLVFSTNYARNLMLHLQSATGKSIDLPLTPDAVRGGLDVDTKPLAGTVIGTDVKTSIRGDWGFAPFTGPAVRLQGAREQTWTIDPADEDALVVGRDDTLHLQADDASCVDGIQFRGADGKEIKAQWKLVKSNQVEVTVPLKNAKPGAMTLLVKQAGIAKPQGVPVHAFAEAGHLESFTLHAGDHQGMLAGTRLNEVASLSMDGITFRPTIPADASAKIVPLDATNTKAASALKSGESFIAMATLRDGRTEKVSAVVDAARPSVILISKFVQDDSSKADSEAKSNIQLSDPNELPQNALLLFSLKAQTPNRFSRKEKIEVKTEDGSYSTMLTLASGLTLQDRRTELATLDPAKAFGSSAFGPLQFRVVTDDGVTGDWQPLATLVRLPGFQSLQCNESPDQACTLKGSSLFLVDSIANDQKFTNPIQVPDGFPGRALPVPHPAEGGQLYVKLRDDPSVVNLVTLTPDIIGEKKTDAKKYRPDYVSPEDSAASSQAAAAAAAAPVPSPSVTPAQPPRPDPTSTPSASADVSPKSQVQAAPAAPAPAPPAKAATAKTDSAAISPNRRM